MVWVEIILTASSGGQGITDFKSIYYWVKLLFRQFLVFFFGKDLIKLFMKLIWSLKREHDLPSLHRTTAALMLLSSSSSHVPHSCCRITTWCRRKKYINPSMASMAWSNLHLICSRWWCRFGHLGHIEFNFSEHRCEFAPLTSQTVLTGLTFELRCTTEEVSLSLSLQRHLF